MGRRGVWVIIILLVVLFVGYHIINQQKREPAELMTIEEGVYEIGNLLVDIADGKIQFEGRVQKREGWVQHLIYLDGYRWLEEESAIISSAHLIELQNVIALIDWKLWDQLWHGECPMSEVRDPRSKVFKVFIEWGEEEIGADKLVLAEDRLGIGEFIFLGSPYFDYTSLIRHRGVDCELCPIFPLKQKALREKFIRESGMSGYELNSSLFPPEGARVRIIIRLEG